MPIKQLDDDDLFVVATQKLAATLSEFGITLPPELARPRDTRASHTVLKLLVALKRTIYEFEDSGDTDVEAELQHATEELGA